MLAYTGEQAWVNACKLEQVACRSRVLGMEQRNTGKPEVEGRGEGTVAYCIVLLLFLAAQFIRVGQRVATEAVCLCLNESRPESCPCPGNSFHGDFPHLHHKIS